MTKDEKLFTEKQMSSGERKPTFPRHRMDWETADDRSETESDN